MEVKIKTIGESLFQYRDSLQMAVICEGRTLTYQDLWRAGTAIAANLIQRGVKKGDRVVLDIERSEKFICMVAGIALAGGIIVYIHRGWPAMQKENAIKDCSPALIVRDDMIPELLTMPAYQTQDSIVSILPRVKGDDPFQIVYTSGSTGKPKGAVLCHLVAANISMPAGRNRLSRLDVETCKRRLLDSDFSFVGNSIEMLRALFNGRTMVVATKEDLSSVSRLAELCKREKIDKVCWTPSRILKLLAEPEMAEAAGKIRVMTVMGEKIPERIKDLLARYMPDTAVFCGYGMSEMMHIEDHPYVYGKENLFEYGSENIGLHILDKNGDTVAEGEKGEVCVSGIPATLGYYWNDKGQTEQKYTRHPRLGRIFHTGDLAVADRNGSFHLAGRGDQMVKLKGMRIDMDAITQAMFEFSGIREAVPMILGEGEAQTLAAFYTCSRDGGKDREASHDQERFEQELRSFLSDRLPYYMVPAWLLELAEMPLNFNGKTDRAALSRMTPAKTAYRASENKLEKFLCEMYQEVLELPDQPGVDDSFFMLGGDSMAGMELASRLAAKGMRMEMKWLFAAPTPALLAKRLQTVEKAKEKAEDQEALPAWTEAQKNTVEHSFGKDTVECLYPVSEGVEKMLRQKDAWMQIDFRLIDFEDASGEEIRQRLVKMTEFHQVLRAVFLFPEGERPVQAVLKKYTVPFSCEDICEEADGEGILSAKQKAAISRIVSADVKQTPDLDRGPLLQVKLFRIRQDKALLYLYYSHALLDGEGLLGILNELLARTKVTPDRELMNRHFHRILYASRKEELEIWQKMGRKWELTSVPAPAQDRDSARPSVRSFGVGNAIIMKGLGDFCRKSSVTMAAVLHYCLGRTICSLLGTKECSFLSVTNGRGPEEKNLPGMFAYEFPFIFHEEDTVWDCQTQLIMASEHAWIFSVPGLVPALKSSGCVVVLDVVNLYVPADIRRESVPTQEVLEEKTLGDCLLNIHNAREEKNRIFIQSTLLLGRLYHGTYCPQDVSPAFVRELSKKLDFELKNLVPQQRKETIPGLLREGKLRILEACPTGLLFNEGTGRERTCIYLKITLTKEVNRGALTKALADTQQRFFHIGKGLLRIGDEFYYIEGTVPAVPRQLEMPVRISTEENGYHSFDVSVGGKDILLSVDHAMMDGVPIAQITDYLLNRYLFYTDEWSEANGKFPDLSEVGNEEADPLLLPCEEEWLLPEGGLSEKAWALPFGAGESGKVLCLETATGPVLRLSRELETSPSILIGLLLLKAVQKVFPETRDLPFVLNIPADYRDGMGVKGTLKNASFPVFMNINDEKWKGLDFPLLAKSLRELQLQRKDVRYAQGNVRLCKGVRVIAALNREKLTASGQKPDQEKNNKAAQPHYESMMVTYLRPASRGIQDRASVSYGGTLSPGKIVVSIMEYGENFHIWFRPTLEETFNAAVRESFARHDLTVRMRVEESSRVISEPPRIREEELPPCVFFFVNTTYGHVGPMLPLIKAFVGRGYQARVYTGTMMREKITEAGGICIPCDPFFTRSSVPAYAAYGFLRLLDVTEGMDEMIRKDCKVFRPLCAIVDSDALWGKLLAEKYGLKVIQSSAAQVKNLFTIAEDWLVFFKAIEPWDDAIAKLLSSLAQKGFPRRTFLSLLCPGKDMDVVACFPKEMQNRLSTFPGERLFFTGYSRYLAPVPSKNGSGKKRPLIYVTMGNISSRFAVFFKNCIEAFWGMDVDVVIAVWKYLDLKSFGPVPENIRLVPEVDQEEVLRRADLAICHAGMNTISDCLLLGVPMILHPVELDQPANAKRVVSFGAGILLEEATPQGIRRAAQVVLRDDSFRKRASHTGQEMRRYPGAEGAADWILARLNER